MVLWGVLSLARIGPFDVPVAVEQASGPLVVVAVAGLVLYAFSVYHYLRLPRHPASPLPLAMAAFILLAEAEIAIIWGRNWHTSWREWHVLMLAAFVVSDLGRGGCPSRLATFPCRDQLRHRDRRHPRHRGWPHVHGDRRRRQRGIAARGGGAGAGAVVISGDTLAHLSDAQTDALGRLPVRGRTEPVEAFRLRGLRNDDSL